MKTWRIAGSLALAITCAQTSFHVNAEPVVVASGAYPEGLLWYGGRMFFTEMGTDRVTIIENKVPREFWRDPGCGPTSIAPFGRTGFIVNCYLGKQIVEVSASGVAGRRYSSAPNGDRLQGPNASVSDGQGGIYFSDSGIFSRDALSTGRVYHLTTRGMMTLVHDRLRYANGINFDASTRTIYVSEHLARRIFALTVDAHQLVTRTHVLVDFARHKATRTFSYAEAGPDGIALRPGRLAVAEYGEGRVHLFSRAGKHVNTLRVSMPFVDTVAWDSAGYLYAGGSFQNTRPPFEGAVVRFAPSEWNTR